MQALAQQHPLSRGDLLVADAALQDLPVGHQHLLLQLQQLLEVPQPLGLQRLRAGSGWVRAAPTRPPPSPRAPRPPLPAPGAPGRSLGQGWGAAFTLPLQGPAHGEAAGLVATRGGDAEP